MLLNLILSLLLLPEARAYDVGITATQAQDKTQTQSGSEASDPIGYGIAFGHEWQMFTTTKFAPRAGYIKNEVQSKDHYSGKYKSETVYILYDFIHPLNFGNTLWFRGGIGNHIKRIKGDGGTVTIPNGGGTATAYKPGKTQQSFTSTLNLGLDWRFSQDFSSTNYGLSFETFWSEIFDSKKRMFTLHLAFVAYF
jgi:hypothetical protein